jgi:hypothetical protein
VETRPRVTGIQRRSHSGNTKPYPNRHSRHPASWVHLSQDQYTRPETHPNRHDTKPIHRSKKQEKGVATTLVRDILNYFNKEKVEEITLRYQIGNKEAEEVWTRLGFQPIITTANTTPEKLKENLRK